LLRLILNSIERLSEWSGRVTAFLLLALAGVIGYEVTVRYGFDSPTIWGTQLAQMLFGTYVVLGGAYALRYRVHVNMDAIYARFSPRTKAIVDLVTSMAFFFAIAFLLWQGVILGWEATMKWETSVVTTWRQPIWPVKLMIPIGALLIFLQGLAKFIRDFCLAITGKELL
jgi:TRAP-type mannitol/chloroaromatic compound transport system permease small subunit